MNSNFWDLPFIQNKNDLLIDTNNNKQYQLSEVAEYIDLLWEKIKSTEKKLAFLFCENNSSTIIYYLALLNAGHAVLLLDNKLNYDIKSYLINRYVPELIFSSSPFIYPGYETIREKNKFSFLQKEKNNHYTVHSNLAVLLSTSGTTGSPKLVRLSYKNIQSNAESIAEYLDINNEERAITSLPMSYSFGLSVINSHLLKQASIVLTDKSVLFKDFWQVFKENNCTSFSGVPYTYQMLKRTGFAKMDLPSLKYFTQAGGRLSEEFTKYFLDYAKNKSKKFVVMYGQTEATARISYVPFKNLNSKIGSIGVPIPGGKIDLFEGENKINKENTVGEIVYSGHNVMMGYAECRNDLSSGDVMNGILRTGDLAYKDADGYYYIAGRMKRFLKVFGLRLNLDEVEKMLQNHINLTVAVTGTDDSILIAVQADDKSLLRTTKQKVSEYYKINPSTIKCKILNSIPTKNTGKFDYDEIKQSFV